MLLPVNQNPEANGLATYTKGGQVNIIPLENHIVHKNNIADIGQKKITFYQYKLCLKHSFQFLT